MKKSSRARRSLSPVLISLCLVFASLLVFTQAKDVTAVRVSEEEVVGKTPTEVAAPPEEKKVVTPPPRPPIKRKPGTPDKIEAEPIIPPQRGPASEKAQAKGISPPAERPATERATPKAVSPPQRPPAKKEPENRFVTIDFDNVDILLFIKFISEVTGKNFVIDDKVRGKVTIVSPTKISVDEAYKVFESVLEVHGFATVPSGSIVKIIPSVEARGKSIETRLREEATSPEDKVITQLIRLDYANPDELKKLFAPLISKNSIMVSYPPSGMLVVTDVLSNIQRLLRIIKAIDVVGIGEEISVIPLEYAIASNMVKTLTTIFQTTGGRPTPTRKGAAAAEPAIRIVADERTNSLILSASEYDTSRIKQLIKILDQETPRGEGDIRVYYLQYADAEELAKVLTALPSKEAQPAGKGQAAAPVISKGVQIVADKATNSLVITANKQDYLALLDVIEKLDISRPMVFIEALIMEVTLRKSFDLGVEWRVGDDVGTWEGREVGAFGASGSGTTIGTAANPPGLSVGVLGETITIGGIEFPSLAAVAQAFESDSDLHILQTPQIMTTDNEEAQVVVASNIPYLSKESAGTEQAYSVYEYKDVGVTLKITPQINQERFLRLEISMEYSTIQEGSLEDRPSTLKRSAQTTVVMKDDHTVVIGGLVGEQISRSASGTPCLGNVPLLGRAFRSSSRGRQQTNLFIFLTPHIVQDPVEATKLYEEKKEGIDRMEESVIKMYEGR